MILKYHTLNINLINDRNSVFIRYILDFLFFLFWSKILDYIDTDTKIGFCFEPYTSKCFWYPKKKKKINNINYSLYRHQIEKLIVN